MKKKELTELKSKEAVQLTKLLSEKKQTLQKTQIDLSVGREKNLKKAKNLKREISQIETVVREKELVEEVKGKKQKARD